MSDGSSTSQVILSTGSSVNGSMRAEPGSGMSSMSEASMLFQPAIDEPSNACPLSNLSMLNTLDGTVTCCSLPLVSVKRRSTNLTSLSLIIFSTSFADMVMRSSFRVWLESLEAGTKPENWGIKQQYPCHPAHIGHVIVP